MQRAECVIDLSALVRNVDTLSARLNPGTQLWPVVKANAYGHGVAEAAATLARHGSPRLCVSTLSEARQLRSIVDTQLLIMGPIAVSDISAVHELDAAVTAFSSTFVEGVLEQSQGRQLPLRVHLKVDTGMGRWGVPLEQAVEVARRLSDRPGVRLEGLMTHFATADVRDDHGFFATQLQRFRDVVAEVKELQPDVLAHAANSAAVLRDSAAHFDAVRCGIGIYGLSPWQRDAHDDGLHPVLSLRSRVADIRQLGPGESVGYGRAFTASEPCRVALVPVGYADGIRRALSGRGEAAVAGRLYPYAGTVSMDHLSLLVDDTVRVGDAVTLIGRDGAQRVAAEDHARWAETINYEITCGMAREPRLARRVVSVEEGAACAS